MNILYVGIFIDHELGGDLVFEKGFLENNCLIERFDYRSIKATYGINEMNDMLIEKAKGKDLVFIGKGEMIFKSTLEKIKSYGIEIALWYGDIRDYPEKWLVENLSSVDYYFMSSGGETLKRYHDLGNPGLSAYYFNPSSPDLVEKYNRELSDKKQYEIIFTGTPYGFAGTDRRETIKYLYNRNDAVFFGNAERLLWDDFKLLDKIKVKLDKRRFKQRVRGIEYIDAIKSAKIGVGVNAVNSISKYTSDRLTHFTMFGTFYLSKDVPNLDELFDMKNELICFNNIDDLDRKLNLYLNDKELRKEISIKAQKKILNDYNYTKITRMMLEIMKTRKSNMFSWIEIIK